MDTSGAQSTPMIETLWQFLTSKVVNSGNP
jgi:hypothetical protein